MHLGWPAALGEDAPLAVHAAASLRISQRAAEVRAEVLWNASKRAELQVRRQG
ncbi:MAG: hypothetical protein NXI12_15445 [Alphaproteobacteria bacterium]|nr:hypothetical protein [Alphaproteobacteria bacterium]